MADGQVVEYLPSRGAEEMRITPGGDGYREYAAGQLPGRAILVARSEELLIEGRHFLRRISKAAMILAVGVVAAAMTATILLGVLVGWLISH